MPRWFGSGATSSAAGGSRPGTRQSHELTRMDTEGAESAPSTKSITEGPVTSDEELESRMSRRSSVLADIISLFRRSSSVLMRPHTSNKFLQQDDYDDEEDEEAVKNMTKERILQAIQAKKEVINRLKEKNWRMQRKRRTLTVARRYLKRQEAKVSKLYLYKAAFGRFMAEVSRWLDNVKIYLIPWESKIKKIESHFGSVVSSYFTFLRWVLSINIAISAFMLLFVIIPEASIL
ncbi:hypothetical protein WR25_02045 [Diploscapter pachys]|uniref:Uncharacterized protein n=1 Tax=Diploscapter pachys TaxID=2018661 RepID=A0A2A2K9Q9_9BILA|nr:hypothetical protein WR25_08327 [Diploscapter pachys]PAV70642.1 hypothetical protein WR25_02045 [Diploscapter pachys]